MMFPSGGAPTLIFTADRQFLGHALKPRGTCTRRLAKPRTDHTAINPNPWSPKSSFVTKGDGPWL